MEERREKMREKIRRLDDKSEGVKRVKMRRSEEDATARTSPHRTMMIVVSRAVLSPCFPRPAGWKMDTNP